LPRTDRQVRPPTTPRPHRRRLARRGRHWRGVPQRALRGARDPVFSVPLRCRRDAVGDPLTAESGCPCHSRLHGPRSEPPLTSVSSIATVEMPSSVWTSSVKWPPQSILGSTISHPALSRTVVSTSDIDHLRCNVSIGGGGVHCPLTSTKSQTPLGHSEREACPGWPWPGRGRPVPRATPVRASQTDIDQANRCRGGCELGVPSNRVWLIRHLKPLYLIGGQLHFD
jgi:hypothetical protein